MGSNLGSFLLWLFGLSSYFLYLRIWCYVGLLPSLQKYCISYLAFAYFTLHTGRCPVQRQCCGTGAARLHLIFIVGAVSQFINYWIVHFASQRIRVVYIRSYFFSEPHQNNATRDNTGLKIFFLSIERKVNKCRYAMHVF
jgi:hypothetical protein